MVMLEVYQVVNGFQIKEIKSGLIDSIGLLESRECAERYLACMKQRWYIYEGALQEIPEDLRQLHWGAGVARVKSISAGNTYHFNTREVGEYE